MDFNTFLNYLGTWTIGSFVAIDLIAATTNAFNGAILAHRRDHRKAWTTVGIILIAVIGGIGGGVTRDVLLNDLPSALTNPFYLILCFLAAMAALRVTRHRSHSEVRRIFDFMAAFSLPWYAIIGAQKALAADLPLIAVILIGVVGPTAGRYFIDLTSGVTPQQFTRGEWFVGTAVLTVVVYIILDALGLTVWPATLLAWLVGFSFRQASLHWKWEEPEPWHEEVRMASEAGRSAEPSV
ncbi:MAG: TRIC cation channel family protein [Anaerolineales bacterium]|nr:TRIC cation channel family protein [Anaerolineales bacterium]